ncbi:echinoderm microtubule-associated -like CG42247 [Olea europaea subsp. europaea]|uniref:Echinoderm microtubule-associated -like CG42247 n=1 Tax=Olea europaea subsp. europaea TaxID=158383 RepID=A0A8S0VM48_OLEEU|nr:echinoderm microtubule-associated -like CG42247 [Olea europaea subsp. europaea]
MRDDSLDYCLTPDELKRMQMSPSLRNSVEFIRRNSVESGRVVRIYKNGEPFEKPLRVCILRDEFSSLNHLLDHINTRLLVPNGARFLFHLDGQPVYSVHELKHNHIYVVSGTRHYDLRTSEVLRELRQREEQTQANRAASQERPARQVNTHNSTLGLAGEARPGERASGASSPSTRLTPTAGTKLARPSGSPAQLQQQQLAPFKPSERYHNWICHSRKHDELIYPAGSLVVLWCRWTNEQRYYSRHTSNVSALTLATLDLDLAASAQVCDLNERPQIASNIHLWSLTSLNTLLVVSDDQLRSKLIFSLCLRNTKSAGCELSIAARDEKQLFLFEFNRKLSNPNLNSNPSRRNSSEERQKPGGKPKRVVGTAEGSEQQQQQQQPTVMMLKASKPLQSNQLPLFLLRVPNTSTGTGQQATSSSGEPTICFGRRHFGIWAGDVKQAKLRPLQCDQRSAKFVELIGRANCLCRLSPGEFICGNSDGNVALLLITCRAGQPSESVAAPRAKRPAKRASSGPAEASGHYSLEVIDLLSLSSSITCLTRVTGSLFMSADSTRTIRFWKIKRALKPERRDSVPTVRLSSSSLAAESQHEISCEQLSSISLPADLGFICTLILAQYDLKESLVEFYVVSTSNTILFGSMKLPSQYTRPGKASKEDKERPRAAVQPAVDLLANSSLSVVYEGHETSATSLKVRGLDNGPGLTISRDELPDLVSKPEEKPQQKHQSPIVDRALLTRSSF